MNLGLAAVLFVPLVATTATTGARIWRWGASAGLVVAVVTAFTLPGWDPRVLSSGAAVYAKGLSA